MNILKNTNNHNVQPTFDMYNTMIRKLNVRKINPFIIYNLKVNNRENNNSFNEKIMFLQEFNLKQTMNNGFGIKMTNNNGSLSLYLNVCNMLILRCNM